MSLPSLQDIVFIFVLLVPGFFAFVLFRKIALREGEVSEFESVVWSLFASLGIYSVFGLFTGFFNLTLVEANILNPLYVASIFGLASAFGVGFGLLARFLFRRSIKEGDCWQTCMKAAAEKGSYLLVYTSNNEEYKGELLLASVFDTPKEIAIGNPKLIIRDKNQKVKAELKVGEVLFFNESDIRRVAYLKEIF
jgi:hypothetical protein